MMYKVIRKMYFHIGSCLHSNYHLSVIVSSNQPARPERRYVSLRDVREHRKLDLQHKLEAFDWSLIDSRVNLDEETNLLSDSLKRMHDESFPLIKILDILTRSSLYDASGISTSRMDINTTYRKILTISPAGIKCNLFARRTKNMKLDQRNGGILYVGFHVRINILA